MKNIYTQFRESTEYQPQLTSDIAERGNNKNILKSKLWTEDALRKADSEYFKPALEFISF